MELNNTEKMEQHTIGAQEQLDNFNHEESHIASFAELQETMTDEFEERKDVEDTATDLYTDPMGKLRVDGTVFVGSIQRRTKSTTKKRKDKLAVKTSNVVKAIGYKITNVETGEWILMEKLEAIDLVRELKVRNASVRSRQNANRDNEGTLVQSNIHLNLHPIRGEKPFTDADRLYPVYKLNPRTGKIIKPLELHLKESQCTPRLWKVIQEHKKANTPKNPNQYSRIPKEEKYRRIDQAFQAANFDRSENPFAKKTHKE